MSDVNFVIAWIVEYLCLNPNCVSRYAIVYAELIYGIYYCFEYFANVGQEADRSIAVCVGAILSFLF